MKNLKIVNIRAIAIIIVVFGHSIILYSPSWGMYNTVNKVYLFEILKQIINVVQMPIFFSLSGYLFYKTISKDNNFLNFLKLKFNRLILPFIFTAIFWMIPIKKIINYSNYNDIGMFEILKLVLTGKDAGHLWYLPTLFLIFLIMYFLSLFLKKRSFFKDLLIFILLLLISIISNNLNTNIYISSALFYSIYFYFGFCLFKYEDYIMNINKKIISLLLVFLMFIPIFINNLYLNYIITMIIILSLYIIVPNKTNKYISSISKNSFGIYLFHSPLVYITYSYFANANPLIVVFINFVIFGSLAFLITELLRKIKLKIFIGE